MSYQDVVKMRIVIDTNVLVGSTYAPRSASRRIVEACLDGTLTMVVSDAVRREYEHILEKAVRNRKAEKQIRQLIATAERVNPTSSPAVVAEDPSDDKFLAVAVSGLAYALITNDRYVLKLDPYEGIRIVRPAVFLILMGDAEGVSK